jgi:hypothetical protein
MMRAAARARTVFVLAIGRRDGSIALVLKSVRVTALADHRKGWFSATAFLLRKHPFASPSRFSPRRFGRGPRSMLCAARSCLPADRDELQRRRHCPVPEPKAARPRHRASVGPDADVPFDRRQAVRVEGPRQALLVGKLANDASYRARRRRAGADVLAVEAGAVVRAGADGSAMHAGNSPVSHQRSSSSRVTSPTGPSCSRALTAS